MDIKSFERILKNPYFQAILFILFAFLVLPTYLSTSSFLCEIDKINLTNCLDSSWVMSLHWALQKNFIFGKDYLFTYGPLGFLGTRTALGFSPLYFLITDLFIIVNLAFILTYAFRRFYTLQALGLCFLIAYITAGGAGMYSDQVVFTLLLISIFWLNYSVEHSKIITLIIPVIITCLLFYIKANMSFIGFILFYVYLLYFIFTDKENRPAKILFGLSVPLIIFLLSFPLKTDIFGYVSGSLSLIDGYNDAMSIALGGYFKFFLLAVASLSAFAAFFFIKNLRSNFLLFLTFGIFSFVLFKQSFVRSDLHIAIFFTFFPAICGLLAIFYKRVSAFQGLTILGISLACLLAIFLLLGYSKPSDKLNYFSNIFYQDNLQERYENSFNRFNLPPEVKQIIGDKSVDIIPWNIDYLYFNRLNYNPRPVIQSYSVYTPYLIDLNTQKYESESAPEFVIFSNASIDSRYALFDDQGVKLSLIKHYSCLGLYNTQGTDFLLFRRTPNNAALNLSQPTEETIKFNDVYTLKDTNKSYFIKAEINYSILGKLVRAAYKPYFVEIVFTLEDGTQKWHRVIVPILKSGVLINPLIEDEKDFYNLVKGNEMPSNKKIKSFRFDMVNPGFPMRRFGWRTFKPDIKLTVSEVSIERKPN
jgi:hypothetical protein